MTVETSTHAAPTNFGFVPARIDGPDGLILFDKGRAISVPTLGDIPGGIYFYGTAQPGGVVKTLMAIEAPTTVESVGNNHWRITSSKTGIVYDLYHGSGCGCGSPVKHMSLPPLRYLNVDDPEAVQF